MPGTTSTALPFFSHDQHHETDVAKQKGGADSLSFFGDGVGSVRPPLDARPLHLTFLDLATHLVSTLDIMGGRPHPSRDLCEPFT